jgi:hypothetical protein
MRSSKLLPPMIFLLLQASSSADGGPTAVMASQVMSLRSLPVLDCCTSARDWDAREAWLACGRSCSHLFFTCPRC